MDESQILDELIETLEVVFEAIENNNSEALLNQIWKLHTRQQELRE